MIELELRDGRILTFEQGASHGVDPGIGSLPGAQVLKIRSEDLPESAALEKGADFLLSDPDDPDRRVAVELKAGLPTPRLSEVSVREQWKRGLAKNRRDLSAQYGQEIPVQLWLLTGDARNLRVWTVDDMGDLRDERPYHLTQVSSRESDVPDAVLAGVSGATTQQFLRRADDWENRVRALFVGIIDWCGKLGPDVVAEEKGTVTMHEDLMQRYAVPARELPILRVRKATQEVLTFKPYGLWVIGANGRVDVSGRNESYFLVDRAPEFRPAQWQLFGSSSARLKGRRLVDGIDFTEEVFEALLRG